MRPILSDTSPAGLRKAIEADITATRLHNNDVPAEPHEEADVAWAAPTGGSDMRGVVTRAAFEDATVERRLDELLRAIDAHDSPLLWWYEAGQRPGDLRERLLARGFFSVGDTAAMALDLGRLEPGAGDPDGVRIEPVDDLDGVDAYVAVVIRNMELDHPPVAPDAAAIRRRYIGGRLGNDPLSKRFVAYVDGAPVATSRVSTAGGVAGLYTVVTMPEARGRGIGRAMTLRALTAGREAGMRIAALQATDMGRRIYERLGFEEQFRYELLARRRASKHG